MSLRRKLILLLCGLTSAVLVVAGTLAYREVRQASRSNLDQLLSRAVDQLAGLAAASTMERLRLKQEVGLDPGLRTLFTDEPTDTAEVIEVLSRLRSPGDSGLAIQVWDTTRALVFADLPVETGIPTSAAPLDPAPSYGDFMPVGSEVRYWSTAPVHAGDGSILGWVVQERRIGNPETAEQLQELVGSSSRIVFAIPGHSVAVSLSGEPVYSIPSQVPPDTTVSYSREDREYLARAGSVPASPWRVLVEVPGSVVEARPAAFLTNMTVVGGVLLLFAVLAAGIIGRGITSPVDELVRATEAMARGDYTGEVATVRGGDELDRLARAFNTMVRRVEGSHAELRLRLEEERKLSRKLEESRIAAEDARREAERANRTKTDFLATISHEIRTPINAVIGYTDLLDLQVSGSLNDAQREQVARIRRSSGILRTLVEDLLDFSRLNSGQMKLERSVQPVRDAALAASAALQPQAMQKDLEIVIDVPAGLRYAGDPSRVEQILMNLLSNAVKFTDDGRIRVAAARADGEARPARLLSDGPWIRIAVEDTGPGLPEDVGGKLFHPFYQGDMSLTRRHGGTGLGLSISRRLARLMGGELAAESHPAGGARFTLWLPGTAVPGLARAEAPGAGAGQARRT